MFNDNYRFSLVALKQPTLLYSIEKAKLYTVETVLGKAIMKDMVSQAEERLNVRMKILDELHSKHEKVGNSQNDKVFKTRSNIIKTSIKEIGPKLDLQYRY